MLAARLFRTHRRWGEYLEYCQGSVAASSLRLLIYRPAPGHGEPRAGGAGCPSGTSAEAVACHSGAIHAWGERAICKKMGKVMSASMGNKGGQLTPVPGGLR